MREGAETVTEAPETAAHGADGLPMVSLVMINYNGHSKLKELLDQSLGTLLKTDYPLFEVIFLDNASTDDSIPYVTEHFTDPRLRVLRSDVNLNYAGGANKGASAARGEVIGVLNNDVIFNPGWLRPLVDFLQKNPRVGAVSPRLLRDEKTYDSLGIATSMMMVAWDRCSGASVLEAGPKDPFRVTAPPGAVFLFPRKILSKTNGAVLDDEYVVYHEDVDFGLRLFLMGYTSVMVPSSAVIHKRGSSLGLMTPEKLYLIRRNAARTGVKLLGSKSLPFIPIWLAADSYASYVYYAVSRDSNYLLVPFRAAWSTVTSFESVWEKHVDFERLRTHSLEELPFSDVLVIDAERIGPVGRVGVTFFNLVAGIMGLGRFKIKKSTRYNLFGPPRHS